jgi:hypothetical protein
MILEMLKKAERVDFRFGGVRSGSFCDHFFSGTLTRKKLAQSLAGSRMGCCGQVR